RKPLSLILDEVERKRKLRERQNSIVSNGSSNEKIEQTEENFSKKFDKFKRSKNLLLKYRIYEFLRRPSTLLATIYHFVAFILVMACLLVSVAPQMDKNFQKWGGKSVILFILERIVVIWFSVEYLIRFWSCNWQQKYQGRRGKWNFVKSSAHLVDLFVIVLSVWVMVWPHEGHEVFAFRAFRGFHRFFQIVQIIITERQLRPWNLFLSVLYDQREQLMIIFYLEIVIFSLLAYLTFLLEHQNNEMIDSMAEAFWWSIVTLTTVGYGDKVPISWAGQILSATFILLGICVFALPAGIIGTGLALKLEQVEQSRQRRQKANSAARLIQRAWFCYRHHQSCLQLTKFFHHQPGDIYKAIVFENITKTFISLIQFHLAKKHFKHINKTVNLRNVIESFKYGQADTFQRLNELNRSIDWIVKRLSMNEYRSQSESKSKSKQKIIIETDNEQNRIDVFGSKKTFHNIDDLNCPLCWNHFKQLKQ
ncbi:potassium voltage-gated channel subfamily KQT-like protein, partial [Sarcoptes scabiei]